MLDILQLRASASSNAAMESMSFVRYLDEPHVACFVDPPKPPETSNAGSVRMTYDDDPTVKSLAKQFGFEIGLIPMKSTHQAEKIELAITRRA